MSRPVLPVAPLRASASRRIVSCASATLLSVAFAASPATAWAANAPPKIWGNPATHATRDQLYTFRPGAADPNGDRLRFSIVNKPKWMWFDAATGKLNGVPHWAQRGRTFPNIVIRVTDGRTTTALPAFSITVSQKPGNAAPVLSGAPVKTAIIGTRYIFKPRASDSNGDALRFGIVGKPAWATFSASTGALYGTPAWRDAGTYSGITLSVTDGKATTRLAPFSLTVRSSTTGNHAPVISGKPATTAQVARPYAFRANASDTDGDALGFSIAGKPDWARFDNTSGTLYGTPSANDVGRYAGITISVSDGKASTTLAPFTIDVAAGPTRSVTLNWAVPTQNVDGSKLTDLAGYRVFYGTASRQYPNSVRVAGAASTSAVIEGLAAGTWYFAIKSINQSGVASDYSGEVRASF